MDAAGISGDKGIPTQGSAMPPERAPRTKAPSVQRHAQSAHARGAVRPGAAPRLAAGVDHSPRIVAQRERIEAAFGRGAAGAEPVAQREITGTRYHCTIARVPQLKKAWCYAATTVIVRRALGEGALTVRAVVKEFLVKNGADPGTLNTMDDATFDLLYGEEPGVEQVGDLGLTEVAITKARLKDMLGGGTPVILALGGHSRVVYSYDDASGAMLAYDPLDDAYEDWNLGDLVSMGATIFSFS
jgi:hypothetical protein